MPHGILIIEQVLSSPHPSVDLGAALPAGANPRRVSWDAFTPELAGTGTDSLLIANAACGSDKAIAFFRWLRTNAISIPVFAILPAENDVLLRAAMESVDDFLVTPVVPEEMEHRIARFLGPRLDPVASIQMALEAEIGLGQLVGNDPEFLRAVRQIALFGAHDHPVLLTGETGTGKELSARVTHLMSRRRTGPFIPVDCGALPDHLFENEVFGHVRGAFTDARSDQKGLVALAQHGTLFLDEIDSLSLAAQSKVLRLLQEHTYRPLGSEVFKRADIRIITASNRNLQELVDQKLFRSDLFFRIHVLRIHLPALRERRSDVPILSRHFIAEICKAAHLPLKTLLPAAEQKLDRYRWPGNIRELYNTLQRAVLCSPGALITAASIELNTPSESFAEAPAAATVAPELATMRLAMCDKFRSAKLRAIQCFEQDYVRRMMEKHAGNVTQAARAAGKDRRAFGRLAKKYGISNASA